ncbi:dihydrodipicolinate synthase family protein [Kibdelosporangium philippinense]|uniref:Dihydrodipicolinate synthase family protein n=1 Tax=Kibdelosporangium philippinense TaxID=211113 RepID=A0ABS8ZLU1_9PSEU|nr:dihydrodipicolinate synthase family protein [Kibdelosporangium philippinense]MCE7007428.1 dihydrodipicolinate synthase family protein [Kibdelosporangium philippinense]
MIELPSGPYTVVSSGGYDPGPAPVSRRLFAAAHVVADPLGDNTPGSPAAVDWDATLAYRNHLWSHGFGVAEAMDTAQRGMGLDWTATQELIRRTGANAAGPLACGAGTDQLAPGPHSVSEVIDAYLEQIAVIEETGGQVILMASRALAAAASGPDDYHRVYGQLLSQTSKPVILHWLGPMFDPLLEGYWGSPDLDVATDVFLEIIKANASAVDGVKISLLDASREVAMRLRLPAGVRCYTGDDFHYPELILGDESGHSDALLGIFDAIAPAAAAAVRALDTGDVSAYSSIFAPTVPLSRHIFGAPTYYYKTGIVFLAWLAGHQSHFKMVGGLESARSVPHLVTLFKLADAAGLLPDPALAVHRMRAFLEVST